jgi:hypothetical protein
MISQVFELQSEIGSSAKKLENNVIQRSFSMEMGLMRSSVATCTSKKHLLMKSSKKSLLDSSKIFITMMYSDQTDQLVLTD